MRAHTLPAAAGWRWIATGFALFRRSPAALAMLLLAYWFTVLLLDVLPFIGPVAASIVIPGLSVGLMQAARDIENGEMVALPTLFSGFREHARALCLLGLIYFFCTLAALGLSAIADGGDFVRFMLGGKNDEAPDALLLPACIVMSLMTPVLMAYWFAPVLVAWHRLPLAKALFFSFYACRLNWRPFLVYGLGLFLVSGVLPGLALGLMVALIPGFGESAPLAIMLPLILVVAPAVCASFYASYRDIFGISEIV